MPLDGSLSTYPSFDGEAALPDVGRSPLHPHQRERHDQTLVVHDQGRGRYSVLYRVLGGVQTRTCLSYVRSQVRMAKNVTAAR